MWWLLPCIVLKAKLIVDFQKNLIFLSDDLEAPNFDTEYDFAWKCSFTI